MHLILFDKTWHKTNNYEVREGKDENKFMFLSIKFLKFVNSNKSVSTQSGSTFPVNVLFLE